MILKISEQNRIEKIRASSDEVKELYGLDELVDKTYFLIDQFHIGVPYKSISEIIGDTILGFYKIHQMPDLFVSELGVTRETAQKMTSELVEFLGPVLKREEELNESKKTDLQKLAESFAEKGRLASAKIADTPHTETTPTASEGTKTPYIPLSEAEKVQPMRTMQGDTTRIHGYGAYYEQKEKDGEVHAGKGQDELIKK
jgi:hypothetical protein